MSTYQRFLLHLSVVAMGVALLYVPVVWVVGRLHIPSNVRFIPANYGHMGLRLAEADSLLAYGGPSMLFIGSSHCYRSFDTRVYDSAGYSSFNLGSSNQSPKQSLALLQRYGGGWPLSVAVIEVHPDIMGVDGDESAVDIISNTRVDKPVFAMAMRQRSLRVFGTMVCSVVDRWLRGDHSCDEGYVFHNTVNVDGADQPVDLTYIPGGYVETSPLRFTPSPLPPAGINVRQDQLEALDRCVQFLVDHGVRCLLVEVPSSKARYNSYLNHDDFARKMSDLAGDRACYLNLNDDEDLASMLDDSTCFFDDDHLNSKGAAILNRSFLQKLTTSSQL